MRIINRGWIGYMTTLAGGIAIGFAAVGSASASQSGPAATASTVVHHYTIAASAFAPDSLSSTTSDYFNTWDPSTLSNSGSRCFNAAATLPNGATIHSVSFFYTNGATNHFYGELNRQNLLTHGSKRLASFTSTPTGTSPVYSKTTKSIGTANVVDTSRFAYSFGVCPFGDATFTGVMVNYTS